MLKSIRSGFFSRATAAAALLAALAGAGAARAAEGIEIAVDASAPARLLDLAQSRRSALPNAYRSVAIDFEATKSLLAEAPMEFTEKAAAEPLVLSLPTPDGGTARFAVVESPIMAPEVAKLYPDIKTYAGRGIDDPAASIRFDTSPRGFYAQVISPAGNWFIEPFVGGENDIYLTFYKREMPVKGSKLDQAVRAFQCHTPPIDGQGKPLPTAAEEAAQPKAAKAQLYGTQLRRFDLAVACTGEYTTQKGSQALAFSAIVTSVNRISALYESELSVRLNLISTTATVYTNAATDPFDNTASTAQINILESTVNTAYGDANVDVSHLYTTDPGGGIAGGIGNVCLSANDGGATGLAQPDDDAYDVDYVAHELGHQFGGRHTWSGLGGSCSVTDTPAFEPGAGSTIMAYAGICGTQDIQTHSDPYFHSDSLERIQTYVASIACGTNTATGNNVPTVNGGADFTIPIGTPFELTAAGTDADAGDTLTYSWEQRDAAAAAFNYLTTADNGVIPLFRVFAPTTSPTRIFPSLDVILAGATSLEEKLPAVARASMDFTVVARDGRGGVANDQVVVTVSTAGGPFAVTSQNTRTIYTTTTQTVTWNVATTTAAPISCANVQILLSTDGGQTFPTVLAASTPNDGSQAVTLPTTTAENCRIKVKAVGNIFFDINNADFAIATAGVPMIDGGTPSVAEGSGATSTLAFNVSLSAPNPGPGNITVDYATAEGTAYEGADFGATAGTLTFLPTEQNKTVNVTVYGDFEREANETVLLEFSNPSANTAIYQDGVGTITDNDTAPRRGFAVNMETGGQSAEGTYNFDPTDLGFATKYVIDTTATTGIVALMAAGNIVQGGDFAGTDETTFYILTTNAAETQFTLRLINTNTGMVTASRGAVACPAGYRVSGMAWDNTGNRMVVLFTDTTGTAANRGYRLDSINLTTGAITNIRTSTGAANSAVNGNAAGNTRYWGLAIPPTGGTWYTMYHTGQYTTLTPASYGTQTLVAFPSGPSANPAPFVSTGTGLATNYISYPMDLAWDDTTSSMYATAYDANFLNNLYQVNTAGTFTLIDNLDGAIPPGYSTTSALGFRRYPASTLNLTMSDPASQNEGNTGSVNFNFTINLSAANPGPGNITVDWEVGGTINAADISSPLSGTATIAPAANSANVTVTAVGDTAWELNERIQVIALRTNSASVLITDSTGNADLNNDDGFVPAGYAFGIDSALDGLVAFNPADIDNTFTRSISSSFANVYAGGDFNGISRNTFYAFDASANNLVSVNTSTGALSTIGAITGIPGGQAIRGMAWDAQAGAMKAMTRTATSTTAALHTVNLATGALTGTTTMAGLTDSVTYFGLAIPTTGSLGYTVDVDAEYVNREGLVSVDRTTAATARVANTPGYDDVAAFVQDVAWDRANGVLYRAGFDENAEHAFYSINTTTGAHTQLAALQELGDFGLGAFQVGAFGIAPSSGPTITNVTSSLADGSYTTGQLVPIQVTFSASVDVTGFPTLTLNTTPSRTATYSSGTGSATLTFNYTVVAGDTAADLGYPATTSLALSGGTINATAGGAAADLTLPAPAATGSLDFNKAIVIDTTAPTVVSINRVGASPTNATSVQWTVTFSESVTGGANSNFSLATTGGISGASIASVTGTGATRTVTVNTGTGDGTIGLDMANSIGVADAAGNAVAGLPAVGQLYTIDKTAPTVVSINRVGATPTNATSVQWTVTFSESVTGGANSNFSLANTGLTTPSITTTSAGPGTTRTVTVNTGTGDGTLGLDMANSTGVADAAGNAVAGLPAVGQLYTIDKTAPTVVSINRDLATPTNLGSVTWTVTFSESVTGGANSNFALANTGLAAPSISSTSAGPGTTRTVTASTGTGDGTLGLNMANSTGVADAAGNAVTGLAFTGQVYTVDRTAPTVVSINRVGASPTNATSVQWTVTFSESVTGGANSNFSLANTGLTTPSITTTSAGPGTTRTVTVNTGTGDGTLGLDMANSTGVADAAGNAVAALPAVGQLYTIDKTAPTVVSINRVGASPTNATSVQWTVTFSESVTGGANSNFSLANTGLTTPSITTTSAGPGTTRTVTVNTGTGDGTIGLDMANSTGVADAAGNAVAGLPAVGQLYTIDKTAPTVVSINRVGATPTNATSVQWTVTFSESVTGGANSNFSLANTGLTTPSITTTSAGPGTTRTVTVNTGTGDGTLGLDMANSTGVADAAGNAVAGLPAVGQLYTIDKTAPTVVSINRVGATPTNATSVQWTVTFSESVTGGANSNFSLANTGLTTPSITTTSAGPGTTRTVTVNTGTGDGTLGLDMANSTGVADLAGNAVAGLPAVGQLYTIDKTAPTVVSIVRDSATPTNAASVSWTVTFSESVAGGTNANFSLANTGLTAPSITSTSAGPGTTRTVTASTGTGSGTLGLNMANSTAVADAAGNAVAGLAFAGEVYTIDKTAPTVVSIVRDSATPTNAASVSWTVTFSETVIGGGTGNYALAVVGPAGASISTASAGPGATRTVTASTGTGDGTIGLNMANSTGLADAAGNPVAGLPATGEVYDIDKTAPTVLSINRAGADPTNAASVQWTVTFSESVAGGTTGNFALANSGLTAPSLSTVSAGPGATRTVTANTGSGSGTLGLDMANSTGIADAAGNAVAGLPATGQLYTIDRAGPTVVSSIRADGNPTNAATVNFTVTFSEDVVNVVNGTFSLTTTGVSGASVTGVSGTGSTRNVAVNTGTGDGTIRLNVTTAGTVADTLGNAITGLPYNAGETYTVNKSAPIVVDITRVGATPTNATSVQFTVTFSESVTGVNIADFALTAAGVTGASVTGVSADTGATRTVTVNTGTGDGTLRLDLVDNDSIVNGITTPLGGTGAGNGSFTSGESYTIDKTAPTVVSIARDAATPTNAASVAWTATFSEDVLGGSASNFALAAAGVSGAAINPISGTGATRSVSASTGTGDGTLGLNLANTTGIADAAGNAVAGLPFTGEVYAIDKTAPVGSMQAVADATRVGTALSLDATAVDASATTTHLWVRRPGEGSFSDTGLSIVGASGTFNFAATLGQNGLYEFAARSTDAAGNAEAAPAAAETTVLLNTVANGAFTQAAVTGNDLLVFPMTDPLDMTIQLSGATPGGTVTLSRTETGVATAPPPALTANHIIDEALHIAGAGLGGFTASLTWNFDPASDDALIGAIDTVFRYNGPTPAGTFAATPIGNTLIIPGITAFSDWYAGNNPSSTDDWMMLE